MYAFHVKAYSHHFTVTNFNFESHRVVKEYARLYVAIEVSRRWDGTYDRTPKEIYAVRNPNRTEYRFHINALTGFIEHCNNHGFPTTSIQFTTVPIYEAPPIELKLLDGVILRDYQVPIKEHLLKPIPSKLVELQTGGGKAQPLDSLIKVPGGWKTMGEMSVGTEVTAADGSVTEVVGVYPQGLKDIYRITFADGRTTECCKEHLWRVYKPHTGWRIINTEELIKAKVVPDSRVYIQLIKPEIGKNVELPLDPYALGVLIGDGSFTRRAVTLSNPDEFIHNRIRALLPKALKLTKLKHGDCDYIISSPQRLGNPWMQALRRIDLAGKLSYHKFVPMPYLNASLEQRLELIRGLLDTDGTVNKDNGSVSYCTTSLKLAKDMQYLIRSVGGMARISSKIPQYTYKGEKKAGARAYVVGIKHTKPSEFLSLPRKKNLTKDDNQYSGNLKLRVDKVEHIGQKEAQCISIAHPDKLYVTNDFVVTHNTLTTLAALVDIGQRAAVVVKGMYVSRWQEDLVDPKKRKLDLKKEDICVVRGTKSLRQLIALGLQGIHPFKIIIITNKTLQNFYKYYRESLGDTQYYGCAPQDMYEVLGIGVRVIDEVHQNFHLNFMQDLYTHIPTTISLSATLRADDPFKNSMYKTMFPMSCRAEVPDYIQYCHVVGLTYHAVDRNKIKYMQRGKGFYSHVVFEESIMASASMLKNYLKMIEDILAMYYLEGYIAGAKALVFAATVEMCTKIRDYLRTSFSFNDFDVRKYTSGDPYDNLLLADIAISTIGSAGTAVDIPDLTKVLSTTAVSDSQACLQNLGRIRNSDRFKETRPEFIYLICLDVPKHIEYHEKKLKTYKGRALTHTTLDLRMRV